MTKDESIPGFDWAQVGRQDGYAAGGETTGTHPLDTDYLVSVFSAADAAGAAYDRLKNLLNGAAKVDSGQIVALGATAGIGEWSVNYSITGTPKGGKEPIDITVLLFQRGKVLVEID